MKKYRLLPLVLLTLLTGCGAIGEKSSSLVLLYAATAILALLTLLGYLFLERKLWFTVLFASVAVVNGGYYLLSAATSLDFALLANRISYLGSVFLPLSMLMIVLDVTGFRYKKWLPAVLLCVSVLVFGLASSYPWLDWYYKDVTLHIVAGAAHLDKEYGSLHILYLVYLTGYFAAMVAVSIIAAVKKKLDSPLRTVVLLVAVFINIGVWLVEQLVDVEFEILSISYIITELALLGLHLMTRENERLKAALARQTESQENAVPDSFAEGLAQLTHTERTIFDLYLEGKSTKEVLQALSITENTLKFHNKNIYSKLGVSSRKQLLQIARNLDK